MGLRYRKSINLGGGFRVNISKSGVGYSWGVKGARITKTAKGTTRKTLSIPGTGISYVEETGKKKKGGNVNNVPAANMQYDSDVISSKSLDTVNAADYQPAEYKELLDAIKRVQKFNTLSTVLIWTFLLSATPFFIFTGIAGIILKIYVHKKMAIPMEYEFDEESKMAYEELNKVWMSLNDNKKLWQNTTSTQYESGRKHGGAQQGVTRVSANATNKVPYFIKLNFKPFGLQLNKKQLFFLPDKLLVIDKKKVGALNYSDMNLNLHKTYFVETDPVPADAKVVRQQWLKVNKNGTPDKRFKDNRQVPVCEYGEIQISSGNTLNVEIMCSNSETVDKMKTYAGQLVKNGLA